MNTKQMTLKQRRMLCGFSQQYVANKIGKHLNTYRKIEKNPLSASVDVGIILSKLFEAPMDEIFYIPDTK